MVNPVADTGEIVAVAAEPGAFVQEQSHAEVAPEMVPVTALQAERRERQQLQEQNKLLQDHMSLMQANNVTQPAPQQEDQYAGMADDDVLTVGEAKKFLGKIQQNYQTSVEELRVQQKYSDYDAVVSQHLPEVVQKNPALKNTLQTDPNRYELAYYLAKNSDSYRGASHEVKKSAEAQRIIDNGQRAGSLSAVGSTSPQSQISNVKNMSDTDFMKMANRNLGRF
tara:strand:+ start:1185 stop:1856 length:672 start_codon:yes stop_codon:yes gene_type:complete